VSSAAAIKIATEEGILFLLFKIKPGCWGGSLLLTFLLLLQEK